MIIPSGIKLPEGEKLEVEVEADGMLCIPNAYKGEYQEFFKGRLTPIHGGAAAVMARERDPEDELPPGRVHV